MEIAAASFLSTKERTVLEKFHERLRKAKGKKSEASTTTSPQQRSDASRTTVTTLSGSQRLAGSASDSQPMYSTYLVPKGGGARWAYSDASRLDRSLRSESGRDNSAQPLHWHLLAAPSPRNSPRQPLAVPSSPRRVRSPQITHEATASLRLGSHVSRSFSPPQRPAFPRKAIGAMAANEVDSPRRARCVATRSRHRTCSESPEIVMPRHEKARWRSPRSQSRSKSPLRWGKMHQSSTASSNSPLRVEHLQTSPRQSCAERASSSQERAAPGLGARTREPLDRRLRQKPSSSNASSRRQSPVGRAIAHSSLTCRYQPTARAASPALPGRHIFSATKQRSQNISVRDRMTNYTKGRLHSRGRPAIRDKKQVHESIFEHDKSSSLWEYYLKSYLHESLLHKIKGDVKRSLEA